MKEIVERLQEKRNIEVAKKILESNGYRVSKVNEEFMWKRSTNPGMGVVSSLYMKLGDGMFCSVGTKNSKDSIRGGRPYDQPIGPWYAKIGDRVIGEDYKTSKEAKKAVEDYITSNKI